MKSWLAGKDSDVGNNWGQEEKGWQRMRWLDDIMTQWTRVWVNSRRQWRTGKPGALQSVGSPRIGPDLETEWRHKLRCGKSIALWVAGNWISVSVCAFLVTWIWIKIPHCHLVTSCLFPQESIYQDHPQSEALLAASRSSLLLQGPNWSMGIFAGFGMIWCAYN